MTLDDLERRIQGMPTVFTYPLLSQERVKLRTANLAGTFIESVTPSEQKPIKNFEEKGVWAYPGSVQNLHMTCGLLACIYRPILI